METLFDNMIKEICKQFYYKGDYKDSEEIESASDKVYSFYFYNELFGKIRFDLEMAITELEREAQYQGFVFGFKKAIELFHKKELSEEAIYNERINLFHK